MKFFQPGTRLSLQKRMELPCLQASDIYNSGAQMIPRPLINQRKCQFSIAHILFDAGEKEEVHRVRNR